MKENRLIYFEGEVDKKEYESEVNDKNEVNDKKNSDEKDDVISEFDSEDTKKQCGVNKLGNLYCSVEKENIKTAENEVNEPWEIIGLKNTLKFSKPGSIIVLGSDDKINESINILKSVKADPADDSDYKYLYLTVDKNNKDEVFSKFLLSNTDIPVKIEKTEDGSYKILT
jgi:hypothetical protein